MKRPVALLVAAFVLSSLVPAFAVPRPGAEPETLERHRPAPGFPNIAFLTALDGTAFLGDSADVGAFVSGFYEAFDANHYLTEAAQDGTPRVTLALGNRFRLARGDAFGDEWQIEVTILGWIDVQGDFIYDPGHVPPRINGADTTGAGRATSGDHSDTEGLRVGVAVLSPDSAVAGAKPIPVIEDLLFQMPRALRAAWSSHAGRMVGLLAVEALHHQSGDLAPDDRIRLDRTARTTLFEHAVRPTPR